MDSLWEYSGNYFQALEEELSYFRKGDLAIAAVPNLKEGLNCLFDGFNWSTHNPSNPVRRCLTRENLFSKD